MIRCATSFSKVRENHCTSNKKDEIGITHENEGNTFLKLKKYAQKPQNTRKFWILLRK